MYLNAYDLNLPPLLDIHQIMEILPHRPPFLLVDRILELSDKHVVRNEKCYNE